LYRQWAMHNAIISTQSAALISKLSCSSSDMKLIK
jgi:hypothetical protein